MMLLVLWVLGAEAGQVGLVAVQTPRVQAPPRGLVPVSIFHQEGDVGAEVELGPQEGSGRAVAEGAQDSQGRAEVWRGARPCDCGALLGWTPTPTAPGSSLGHCGPWMSFCPTARQPPLGAGAKAASAPDGLTEAGPAGQQPQDRGWT